MSDLPPSNRLPRDEVVSLLSALGVGDDEIARAEADGNLVLLAIDHLALGQEVLPRVRARLTPTSG